ncbi:ATP-binding protein [Pedomonas sp. V897]|uniref:ATP-binding protein n=1 Tax=Pedomonas sp. V897 TaxID=3446482 RepID=UPI003EDF04FA
MDPITKRLLQRLCAASAAALAVFLIVTLLAGDETAAAACAVIAGIVVIAVAYDGEARDREGALERERALNAELQARLARDQVRQILEAINQPLLIVDHELTVHRVNHRARDLLGGVTEGEALTLFLRQPGAVDAIRSVVASGTSVEREVQFFTPVEAVYMVGAHPIGGQQGLLLVWMRDVTKDRLTDRMRVDFVANASHELRTPLATLIGFIETLQGPAASDEAARTRFLGIMAAEAARMARLIDDLLSLSRIEMDKHVRPSTLIDMRPLLGQVEQIHAVQLEADRRRIDLRLSEPLPRVIADRDQVLQVLHNLVSNAIKYGRTGTPITLEATPVVDARTGQPTQLRIAVTDQGEGIAPEHLPRLTERFFRVDTARSRKLGGTGLGLAIVKHIVEKHRGELTIQSRPGTGTTVAFTLPAEPAQTA